MGAFDVYQRYVNGEEEPESVADGYGLTVAEVHAALAYAFHNADEMRAIEAREVTLTGERVRPEDES